MELVDSAKQAHEKESVAREERKLRMSALDRIEQFLTPRERDEVARRIFRNETAEGISGWEDLNAIGVYPISESPPEIDKEMDGDLIDELMECHQVDSETPASAEGAIRKTVLVISRDSLILLLKPHGLCKHCTLTDIVGYLDNLIFQRWQDRSDTLNALIDVMFNSVGVGHQTNIVNYTVNRLSDSKQEGQTVYQIILDISDNETD